MEGQIKRENIEIDDSYDTTELGQSTSMLAPTEEVYMEDLPNSEGEGTATCKETNFKVYLDGQIKRKEFDYNTSCDTTGMHESTFLLSPTEQMLMEDLPNSEGEGTSTCKKVMSGISQEEASGSDGHQKHIKLEDDDCLEIKEEILSDNAQYDDTCDVQVPHLWPLPEVKLNLVQHKLKEPKQKKFTCDVCNKTLSRAYALVEHMRMHTRENLFNCAECNKAFLRKGTLIDHMRLHAKENPFTCHVCDKGFTHKARLTEHIRVHTKEKPFTCDICKKSFKVMSHLVGHMRVHTKEKPFTCDVCNKSFARKTNLSSHKRVHTKERPYPCDVCHKTFTSKSNRTLHMIIHKNKLAFACHLCSRSFSRKRSLLEHMRIHLKECPFTCEVCNKSFTRNGSLLKHMRVIHQKDNTIK